MYVRMYIRRYIAIEVHTGVAVHVWLSVGTDCCRQVAALHSDHYRQVLLYMVLLDQGRLAAVVSCLKHRASLTHT